MTDMNQQGILVADLQFSIAHIHYGKRDGKDFAQISYPDLGDMNGEVKSVSIKEQEMDFLIDINGFDMWVHITDGPEGMQGKADLDTIGIHSEFMPAYLQSDPGFAEHHFVIPAKNLANLKAHNAFTRTDCKRKFTYDLNDPSVFSYLRGKGICVENHHDLATVCLLMKQTSALIQQDGVNYCHDRDNIGTIAQMEHAFRQGNKTNCRGVANIMAGVLRAYGFKANIVTCFPLDPEDRDCHVVCEVFLDELQKTILLDPSSNMLYFQNGVPLNLMELREAIVKGEADQLHINEDAIHNGEPVEMMQIVGYMSKNLFYLVKSLTSNETMEATKENSICLTSKTLGRNSHIEAKIYTSNVKEFYL